METGLLTAFYIILIHYVADFALQTEDMATRKSKEFGHLVMHTMVYSFTWLLGAAFLFSKECDSSFLGICVDTNKTFIFVAITFVTHTITDYFTSRWTSKLFASKTYYTGLPNFGAFSVIGIDQVLHYAQLFLTFYFLSK
jgi:hypothetical protein